MEEMERHTIELEEFRIKWWSTRFIVRVMLDIV